MSLLGKMLKASSKFQVLDNIFLASNASFSSSFEYAAKKYFIAFSKSFFKRYFPIIWFIGLLTPNL